MRRAQANQQMHMVLDPVDRLRNGLQSAGCATQVFVKLGAPIRANKRTPVLRAEHNVIMKAKKCRTHNPILLLTRRHTAACPIALLRTLAPLRGASHLCRQSGGIVAGSSTPGE